MLDQFVQLQRSIIAPESLGGVSLAIPAPVSNSYLRWNALADALENDTTIPQAVIDSDASAAAAAVSESNAGTSESNALAYLNDFKGRYYGALASDPALDPLGAAITNGDVYYNSASNELRYYNGSWVAWNISTTQLASLISNAASKATPVDADLIGLIDSADSFSLKKLTIANLKTALGLLFAPLLSPVFTGTPTAPVPTVVNQLITMGNIVEKTGTSIGYGTGSGGTVTQATSRTTTVTLNKPCGAITLFSAAGSTTWTAFQVLNSTCTIGDTVVISVRTGATNIYETLVYAAGVGSFNIAFRTTGGTATDAPIFDFTIIKGAQA